MSLLPDTALFPKGAESFRNWHNLDNGSLAVVLAQLRKDIEGLLLVITPDTASARELADSLSFYCRQVRDNIMVFPDWETLPYDLFSPHQDIISERIEVLHRLPENHHGILIAPVNTLMHRLPPQTHILSNSFALNTGDTFSLSHTRERLTAAGYRQREIVYEHGEFAVRGAIMDIFPMGSDYPFRIELFDDAIESLRLFDPESQRSTEQVESIDLLPAAEYSLSEQGISQFRSSFREHFDVDHRRCPLYQDVSDGVASAGLEYYLPLFYPEMTTLFDYLPEQASVIQLAGIEQAASHFWDEVNDRYESRCGDLQRPILAPSIIYLRPDELNHWLKHQSRARLTDEQPGIGFPFARSPIQDSKDRDNPFAPLIEFASHHPGIRLLICAESAGRREALLDLMQKVSLQPRLCKGWDDFLQHEQQWQLTIAGLEKGFYTPDENLLVVAEAELYGERILQRRRRRSSETDTGDQAFRSLGELSAGSPVVHLEHGIGRYKGLAHMQVDGQQHEFLLLEYAGGDKIYVPVSSLHLISRYGGGDPEHAPLTRLGSDQWSRARQKAAEKIHDVAAELLHTLAQRESRQGRAFSIDQEDYRRFSRGFPFEETADQQNAIEAVLADLQADQPMDRLVCGDVGFGKTEVAMRAAFVAVQNNTQVAVLVPTTLLAQQHFDSFSDRFADWPVNIEVLSRFRTQKEKKQVLERLTEGKVDIVVGTHQLLQESIRFCDLGLLVVDEEHRFGVRHKEKLKQLRAEADILTLTATPIPRTLNMAFSGLRDISIIATAPEKRLSVKTFVQRRETTTIKEALLRELLRGGQVYYLHNDIDTMQATARTIRELVPDARVGIAHGQMRERELESAMSDFYHRRFNVLLCTTIIETGIDVPSANTIIIERADKFGLAQLHQLRGRVGRSHHQAYAYLLTPPPKVMTKDAQKRLEVIRLASDLGAGFTLASHDLEIRGAGELLGDEQSGHIENIGFSLYMEMLEQAVEALKRGEQPDARTPLSGGPEINLGIPALIPDEYLPDVFTRLTLYKRIASCKTQAALKEIQVEMIDRFGLLPAQVKNLFRVTRIRQQAEQLAISRIDLARTSGRILFSERTSVDPLSIVKLVQSAPSHYQLQGANVLKFNHEAEETEERFIIVERLLELFDGKKQQNRQAS